MNNKEQVLKFYPDAVCDIEPTSRGEQMFIIRADARILTRSFESEEKAWGWALLLVNHFIMNKFKL